ncbi:hypothetical protein [Shimia sp. SDUM112013]|uniref:hypothetical protein n=1 Tax=Shimia sp. SDUM112013 TaxID=3136160 RepID=UPI0032EC82F8
MQQINESPGTDRKRPSKTVGARWVAFELVFLTAMLIAVVASVYLDVVVWQNGLSEKSLTETLHNLFILCSGILFLIGAKRHPEKRGYLIMVGAFFMILFIRENDKLLDGIWHGFWSIPATVALAIAAVPVWLNRKTISKPFLAHYAARDFVFLYMGFLLLVVFSRLMGTSAIWEAIMQGGYNPMFKTVIQEGLELLGYSFILYGSALSLRIGFSAR